MGIFEPVTERKLPADFLSVGAFRIPTLLDNSAWIEHLPFASWITEALRPRTIVELGTHTGVSYCGFCEAVRRLDLDARCYAIDTWKGDEHAGFYGEEVFQKLSRHHAESYSAFSTLVRSTFDGALPHFDDGSIDLLHIDGRHFYEDVKHDFESWLPKLSPRAVVLMHDTNVRERGFGVSRLWNELTCLYPSFEFLHGHGLGILGVGPEPPELVKQLFFSSGTPAAQVSIRECYSRLGKDLAARLELEHAAMHTKKLEEELSRAKAAAADNAGTADREKNASALARAELRAQSSSLEEAKNALWREKDANEKLREMLYSKEEALQKIHANYYALEAEIHSLKRSASWKWTPHIRWFERTSERFGRSVRRDHPAETRGNTR
jgi:Methyltransferase domain